MFQKVLVPVDGSQPSMKAVETARKLIEEGSAKEVSLVHVVQASEIIPVNGPNMSVDYPQFYDELTKTAQRILEDARTSMGTQKPAALLLEAGPPAEIICRIAKKDNFDLIIIGNRGLNRFQRVLLGSISTKVITQAHCPVLVVK